jgi:TolB-like protein/Tfp pilus assembly protein PilF
MQENEPLARLKRKRLKEVLEATISKFNGKVVQYYGDGSLSIFGSAIECVDSAISIQQQLQQEPKVSLRMGIHTGDVAIEDESIYGDGVNLASRIESLAVPGGIFISEKVYDEIRNQQNIQTREMGYFELKNVKLPVRIFAIANSGVTVPRRDELRGKTKQTNNRLAVLPFVNMSTDPENEYFSDGITEELLNALTRVEGLQVTSRTSAFAFKGKNTDIRDIAIQLNVDRILEGSVRKSGNRVRITAQLINAADGYHIWSESYDRNLTDIFEVQDEISSIIAGKLQDKMSAAEKTDYLVKAPIKNVAAYTHYLRGLHYLNKITPADSRKAIECFEEAIALEPNYAQAYARSAGAYSHLAVTGQMLPDTAFEVVKRYADKALQVDDTIAEGHIAKGSAYLFYDWKWKEAFDELQKAIELNPSAIDAYQLLGYYYLIMGQKLKAVEMLEEAEKIDPLSPVISQTLGNMYLFAGRYDEAIVQADKMLDLNPTMRISIEMKGWATGLKGDWETALTFFKEVHRLTNHPLKGLIGLGFAYAHLGQRENAVDVIRKMEQRQEQEAGSVIDPEIAAVWFALGDFDKAFYYANRAVEKRVGPISYFFEYPQYKSAKKDPRYKELLRKQGFDEELIESLAK